MVLVDAHVHLHDTFAVRSFLEAAAGNFAAAGRAIGAYAASYLMFVESRGVDNFGRLASGAAQTGEWDLQQSNEAVSLVARKQSAAPLVLVAGRQIVSAEGIEVLALGTRSPEPDGRPLADTVAAVRATGALPVLPWGFGKWWGRRGRLVEEQVEQSEPGELFLGDNGGRLASSGRPPLFERAEARGIAVIPGSDPLPLPGEVSKVGRYAFPVDASFAEGAPFATLRQALCSLVSSPRPLGRLEHLHTFVYCQVAMQLRKRLGRLP